jgi:hypothetical protein
METQGQSRNITVRRKAFSIWLQAIREGLSGTTLIAGGTALLLVSVCRPQMPAVTAMALVALGATDVTLARFRWSPAVVPILVLHATTYGGLFALFVGAVLDAAARSSSSTLSFPLALDLAASTLPAAVALRRIGTALRSHRMAGS